MQFIIKYFIPIYIVATNQEIPDIPQLKGVITAVRHPLLPFTPSLSEIPIPPSLKTLLP